MVTGGRWLQHFTSTFEVERSPLPGLSRCRQPWSRKPGEHSLWPVDDPSPAPVHAAASTRPRWLLWRCGDHCGLLPQRM